MTPSEWLRRFYFVLVQLATVALKTAEFMDQNSSFAPAKLKERLTKLESQIGELRTLLEIHERGGP